MANKRKRRIAKRKKVAKQRSKRKTKGVQIGSSEVFNLYG